MWSWMRNVGTTWNEGYTKFPFSLQITNYVVISDQRFTFQQNFIEADEQWF